MEVGGNPQAVIFAMNVLAKGRVAQMMATAAP